VTPRRFFYLGVFLVTASTLILQVVQTRILSVVTWYYLAFFVISMAMFGLTAGAVWVYLQRGRFTALTLSHDLAVYSVVYSIVTSGALVIQLIVPPMFAVALTSVLTWTLLAVAMAAPFFCSGVVVSLALTRSPYPVGRVYGVDLAGAAFGCLASLALISVTDGPSVVLWAAAMGAAASYAFSCSGAGPSPARRPGALIERRGLILAATCVAAVANGSTDVGLVPLYVKGHFEGGPPLFRKWNSFSRVVMSDTFVDTPQLWGASSTFPRDRWRIPQRHLNIDGEAGTSAYELRGDVTKAGFLRYDVTNVAYHLPGHRTAAIIGVGGGRDMIAARLFGIPDVTGIEINPTFVRLLKDDPRFSDFVGMNAMGGMTFVIDEARSWFARSDRRFDVIQMSLIDTWAATGAGAFTLSENSLYTVEAWQIFMRHLTPQGVFTVSRWFESDRPFETSRMISLAMATLFALGAPEPRRHLVVATSERIATLILSPRPFSAEDLATLDDAARTLAFRLLAAPHVEPGFPSLGAILGSTSLPELVETTSASELDETPATDERPFFFNQLPLRDPLRTIQIGLLGRHGPVVQGNLRATATLVVLFLISLGLVVAAIVWPLRPALADVGRGLVVAGTAYFLLIGVGFMSVEIGLLQRMSVFLGHPTYSLSIVLFSLILATGAGSLVSDAIPLDRRWALVAWPLVTAAYFWAVLAFLPSITARYAGEPLLLRATIAVLIIGPGGMLLGWGFPTGMRLVERVDRTPTPWFWGVNGAAGVLASSLAVACSIALGISTTIAIGTACYLLLVPAALAMHRSAVSADGGSGRML
jgi:hypothetical protein